MTSWRAVRGWTPHWLFERTLQLRFAESVRRKRGIRLLPPVAAVAVLVSVLTGHEAQGSPWEQGWALLLVIERAWELGKVSV